MNYYRRTHCKKCLYIFAHSGVVIRITLWDAVVYTLVVTVGIRIETHSSVYIDIYTRFYLHTQGILRSRMGHDRWIVILMFVLLTLNSHYFARAHMGELVYNFTRVQECACISQGDHPGGHGNGCNRVYLRVRVHTGKPPCPR